MIILSTGPSGIWERNWCFRSFEMDDIHNKRYDYGGNRVGLTGGTLWGSRRCQSFRVRGKVRAPCCDIEMRPFFEYNSSQTDRQTGELVVQPKQQLKPGAVNDTTSPLGFSRIIRCCKVGLYVVYIVLVAKIRFVLSLKWKVRMDSYCRDS